MILLNLSVQKVEKKNDNEKLKKKIDPRLVGKKIGRNELCFCGSKKVPVGQSPTHALMKPRRSFLAGYDEFTVLTVDSQAYCWILMGAAKETM